MAKNLEYSSMIGCNADEPKTITKKTTEQKICKHASYGCTANTTKEQHKTERSKHCTFNGKTAEYIAQAKATYEKATASQGNGRGWTTLLLLYLLCFILFENRR